MKTTLTIVLASTAVLLAQTNVVTPDKVEITGTTVVNWLTGILAAVSAFLAWYARNKSMIAALVGPLMRNIEKHGSKELKSAIKNEAGELGIQPTMHAQKLINVPPLLIEKPVITIDPLKL